MTHIDVQKDRDARLYRCWVDGVEVTDRCYAANDEEGWADCYKVDGTGHKFIERGQVARERLTGVVRLEKSTR